MNTLKIVWMISYRMKYLSICTYICTYLPTYLPTCLERDEDRPRLRPIRLCPQGKSIEGVSKRGPYETQQGESLEGLCNLATAWGQHCLCLLGLVHWSFERWVLRMALNSLLFFFFSFHNNSLLSLLCGWALAVWLGDMSKNVNCAFTMFVDQAKNSVTPTQGKGHAWNIRNRSGVLVLGLTVKSRIC